MSSPLSNGLLTALADYAACRERGKDIDHALSNILSGLELQKLSSISDCDNLIAREADLSQWQPAEPQIKSLFTRQASDRELLSKRSELASLFIFHRNGFLRQMSLDLISAPLPNAFLVAALACRLNDWVSQVRQSAVDCARRCLPQTNAEVLAKFYLATFRQRESWGRWSSFEKDILDSELDRPDVVMHIVKILSETSAGPMPSSLTYLLRHDWIDQHLKAMYEHARIPGVRAIALRTLINKEASYAGGYVWRWVNKPMGLKRKVPQITQRKLTVEHNRKDLIRAGVADVSSLVRRVALSGIIKHHLYEDDYLDIIRSCAGDPSFAVRSRAEYIMRTA